MQFKVNSKELEKVISKVFPGVPTRTPVQILENFLFILKDGVLTVYATDLELSLKSSISVVSDGDFEGVVPARLFYDTIRSLDDTAITIDVEERNRLRVNWGKGEVIISYIKSSEFPEIPSFPKDENEAADIFSISMKGMDLKYALDKTSFAISKEEIRPAMMGTLFEFSEEGLRFVATDGHRLVNLLFTNISTEATGNFIVAGNVTSILQKVLDEREVKIYFRQSHATFILNDMELIASLISERYPDYKAVIPLENEYTLIVNPKELLSSVKRMMLFTAIKMRKVKLALSPDKIEVSAEDIDLGASGKEEVASAYDGEPMEIGFNATYLSDVLSHLGDNDEVHFKLHTPNKAVVVYPKEQKENYELVMLLMPVRLNS
jgi:DNA polymerase-3 subunit beta